MTVAPSPLLNRLASLGPLSQDELSHIGSALGEVRAFAAHQDLRPGAELHGAHFWVLERGWAGSVALMEDGRRQIVDLAIPGDIVNSAEVARDGLTVQALTDVRFRDAARLSAMAEGAPQMSLAAAWRASVDSLNARRVRHLVRLGGMLAFERTADFLLELRERQARAGLTASDDIVMPLTQEALSDYLGLSVVHLNRVMQHLRRDGLIDYRPGRVTLASPQRLHAAVERGFGRPQDSTVRRGRGAH